MKRSGWGHGDPHLRPPLDSHRIALEGHWNSYLAAGLRRNGSGRALEPAVVVGVHDGPCPCDARLAGHRRRLRRTAAAEVVGTSERILAVGGHHLAPGGPALVLCWGGKGYAVSSAYRSSSEYQPFAPLFEVGIRRTK